MKSDIEVPKRIENANSRVVAGALFDFMGYLTTREKQIVLSGHDNASPAVEAIQEFASKRGLSLEEPDVRGWQNNIGGA